MTTVDHKTRHVWGRMATGKIRCTYQLCNARPDAADVAKLEAVVAADARGLLGFASAR